MFNVQLNNLKIISIISSLIKLKRLKEVTKTINDLMKDISVLITVLTRV